MATIVTDRPSEMHSPGPWTRPSPGVWAWAALAVSVIVLGGSLYLSLGMKLKACGLCFYQRTFVMGVVGVLALGLCVAWRSPRLVCLLALPAAAGGLGVAVFHVYLEQKGALECPGGLFGWGSAPVQALAAQAVLLAVLGVAALRDGGTVGRRGLAAAGAVLLGIVLAAAAVASAPPAEPRTTPYPHPTPDVCRPPYHPN
jgi:disulfide bond formation protein DsbB